MRKYLTLLFAGLAALTATAQPTLDACRRAAREHYPLVRRYELLEASQEFTLEKLSRAFLPQVSLTLQGTLQSGVPELPDHLKSLLESQGSTVEGLHHGQYRAQLDVTQTVWDGGRNRAQRRETAARTEVSRRQTDVELHQLYSRVDELFFGLLLIDRQAALNRLLTDLLASNRRQLETYRRHGTATQADVDAVEAERVAACQQAVELQVAKERYAGMLSLLTGLDVPADSTLPRPPAIRPATEAVRRPELMFFDARSLLADARRRSLDAALRPRVDAFAQGYYGNPGMNMFDDMMRYRLSLNGLIGIRLNWNIGALYTRRADLASLDNEREQIRTERETFLFNNRQDVVRLHKEVERLEKLRPGDAELVRLRTSIRRAAEAKLRGGVIDADALLEKITDEHRAQVEASVHDIELLKTLYALQTLTQSPL